MRLLLALVVAASVLTLVAGVTLMRSPGAAAQLAPGLPAPRLILTTPRAALLVGERGAARIDDQLRVTPVAWPAGLTIRRPSGVAALPEAIAVAFSGQVGDRRGHGVLEIVGDQATVLAFSDEEVFGLDSRAPYWVWFQRIQDTSTFHRYLRAEHQDDHGWRIYHPEATYDGITWMENQPVAVTLQTSGKPVRLEPIHGATGELDHLIYTPSLLALTTQPSVFMPAEGEPWRVHHDIPAFLLGERGELEPISIEAPPSEESGQAMGDRARVTRGRPDTGQHSVSTVDDGRHRVRLEGAVAATLPLGGDGRGGLALPLGERWLVLSSDLREAGLFGAHGERLDGGTRAAALRSTIRRAPVLGWVAGALLLLLPLVPVVAWWTRRRQRTQGRRSGLVGCLQLPQGVMLVTGPGGVVPLPADGRCSVRVDGRAVALGPSLCRVGARRDVPLVDGDEVVLHGRIEEGEDGPFRSDGRARLVPDGGGCAIERQVPTPPLDGALLGALALVVLQIGGGLVFLIRVV